jgi:hypothetical protein
MNEEEARKKVNEDPDFVNSKRYDYSLQKLEERYPDGAPDNVIANALMIEEKEVEPEFDKVVVKLREKMGVEEP